MEAERGKFDRSPLSGFDRGVRAECCVVPAPSKRQIRSDGNADRSRGNSLRKLASFQPFGLNRSVVSRAVGFLAARDRARSSCVRSVVASYPLRDIRFGSEASGNAHVPAKSCKQGSGRMVIVDPSLQISARLATTSWLVSNRFFDGLCA